MTINKTYTAFIAAAILMFSLNSCSKNYETETPSIATIAVSNADFSILEGAAVRGGLAIVLANKNPNDAAGNYTVFAPNNAAFARLGFNTEGSLGALQKSFLTNTLLYHVSNGTLLGKDITAGNSSVSAFSVNRKFINRGMDKYINGSKIVGTDVSASNGTVHIIDKVLLATGADIVQSALALRDLRVFTTSELSFLVEALVYTDLVEALTASAGSPSFTVFAPTDAAFKDLGVLLNIPLSIPSDIRKIDKETVKKVLLNHVIADSGKFTSEMNAGSVMPLGGVALTIGDFNNGVLTIKGKNNATAANMVIPDVLTTNGIVHVIDRVLLP
jgi:uncharacterized surface protein with fasciclin (FAS1) repeats